MNHKQRNHWRFDRWETWVALIACGGCAALGDWIGQHFGYAGIGAAVGGGLGGWLMSLARNPIAMRDDR